MVKPPLSRRTVMLRTAAATAGGYTLAAVTAVALGIWLPLPRAEAVMTGMLVSVVVWVGAWIWAFATPSTARAWLWIGLPMALLALLAWLLPGRGAP